MADRTTTILRVDGKFEVHDFPDTSVNDRLHWLQRMINAQYVEEVRIPSSPTEILLVDENGRLDDRLPNLEASRLAGRLIVGDAHRIRKELLQ